MSGPLVFALRLVLALALYAFLAFILVTLFRDLKTHAARLSTRKAPPISLTVLQPGQLSQVCHFHQPGITIGRSKDCECTLDEDTVSSRHARLSYHHGQWWLEDLGSTNGTFLNDEKLLLPTVVVSGDRVRCGEATFMLSLSGDILNPIRSILS